MTSLFLLLTLQQLALSSVTPITVILLGMLSLPCFKPIKLMMMSLSSVFMDPRFSPWMKCFQLFALSTSSEQHAACDCFMLLPHQSIMIAKWFPSEGPPWDQSSHDTVQSNHGTTCSHSALHGIQLPEFDKTDTLLDRKHWSSRMTHINMTWYSVETSLWKHELDWTMTLVIGGHHSNSYLEVLLYIKKV